MHLWRVSTYEECVEWSLRTIATFEFGKVQFLRKMAAQKFFHNYINTRVCQAMRDQVTDFHNSTGFKNPAEWTHRPSLT